MEQGESSNQSGGEEEEEKSGKVEKEKGGEENKDKSESVVGGEDCANESSDQCDTKVKVDCDGSDILDNCDNDDDEEEDASCEEESQCFTRRDVSVQVLPY